MLRDKLQFMIVRCIVAMMSAFIMVGVTSCDDSYAAAPSGEATYIPAEPDYATDLMWVNYCNDVTGEGADVFYVPSTWEYDWTTPDGLICHYADPSRPDHRADMKIEIDGVADYMSPGNNFYSPFYRHVTLDTWATLNEDTINSRYFAVSFPDVKHAFDHFIHNFNSERPFILAGFSQGGKSVVELMKTMPDSLQSRMIAAYVMGYKITPADTITAPWIKTAEGATDTGVTICYNSVSDVRYTKPIVSEPNVMAINPVNWVTDATPATLDDTITVTLHPTAKVLVVEGYDGSSLPNILNILNVGDYHGAEPWLYSSSLRQNFADRIAAYRKGN